MLDDDEEKSPEDIQKLRELVINGNIDNKERRNIWRYFLQIPTDFQPTIDPSYKHPDYEQVEKDVKRSYGDLGSDPELQKHKREQLKRVIMSILERHKDLHFYQGFHYIAMVVLKFAREPLAMLFLERLAIGPLFYMFQKQVNGLVSVLNMLFPLLALKDPEYSEYLEDNTVGPSVVMPYIITWFTQAAPTKDIAFHLLDFFVVSHPIMPLYTVAVLLLEKKEQLIHAESDQMQELIQDLMKDIDVDSCIQKSMELYQEFPPVVVFERNPTLTIARELNILDPRVDYPFPFPKFPEARDIPTSLYDKRLSDKKDDRIIRLIISAFAIIGTIGLRMLDT